MLEIDDFWILENIKKFYKKKVVIIAGAGISVESGIPDFRSKKGIFSDIKEKYKVAGSDLFTYRFSLDSRTRPIYLEYISLLKRLVDNSKPSLTHSSFKSFLGFSKKFRVYTQNIDGLEEKAGLPFSEDSKTNLVYLHGDLKSLRCINCGNKEDFSEEYAQTFEKKSEIECKACSPKRRIKYFLHTSIIHYYQDHPFSDLISSCIQGDTGCNLLIVVGTRLDVFGVKNMVKYFKKTSRTIFVNPEPPRKEIEPFFDFYYPGKSDEFFLSILKNVKDYKMTRRIKRLSIQKEDVRKVEVIKKDDVIKKNLLKRHSLTNDEIHSSFLTFESKTFSPIPKKKK